MSLDCHIDPLRAGLLWWRIGTRLTSISPLRPAELQVLRAQYEKEGEHVGVQTKFNFAWVRIYFSVVEDRWTMD